MLRIGISGWIYPPWRGVFYPPKLAQRRELEFASRAVSSIEINGSFYSLQRPESYRAWYEETPEDFLFSVKGPRFITHMLKLSRPEEPLANFFASGVLRLGKKLGPLLWQLPPMLKFNAERVEHFFRLLPRDTDAAAAMAKKHGARMEGRAWTNPEHEGALRHCMEVRHPSFLVPEFFELLRAHGVAFVFADTAGRWPYSEDLTADFVYIRLHGAEELYASGYTESALDWWAERIRLWRKGRQPKDARLVLPHPRPQPRIDDIFVYFDNDAKVRAPFDAQSLQRRFPAMRRRPSTLGTRVPAAPFGREKWP
jgi:uncharacterized protein YecE (DUF72 family)